MPPNGRDLRSSFEDFAAWCEGTSPLYARLASAIASAADLLEVATIVPRDRSAPHVLLGAVHFHLLRGAEAPLAEYYPSVVSAPRAPDAELVAAFRSFVTEHRDALEPVLRTRRTQTNAVGRSAALYPAFAHLAPQLENTPALIDLGASAGLNLLWDRYAYDYDDRVVGIADSPARIECSVRDGTPPLPADPPTVRSRRGIDLNPLDPTDQADADWLRALVWPEHADRRARLEGALTVARREPPDVVAGDAIERLPDLVRAVPADVPVCLVHTLFTYQLSEAARDQFHANLRALGEERPLHWIGTGGATDRAEHAVGLQYGTVTDGELDVTQLGIFEAHGRWLRWTAPG